MILLVDDNPHDVVLIRLAFRKAGIIDTINCVRDGREAMSYLKGEGAYADRNVHPEATLMLLDLNMPFTSGFDVLKWARSQEHLKDLAIIVMTGSRDTEDIERAYALGATSYVVKPSRFSDLVRMMRFLKESCGAPGARLESPTEGAQPPMPELSRASA